MSIYISNSLYISGSLGDDYNQNNPIIGYHSVLTPDDISASILVDYTAGGEEAATSVRPAINAWTPDTASVWEGFTYSGLGATVTSDFIFDN